MGNQFINGNWVDLFIILVLAFFASEGYRIGFAVMGIDFLSFFASLIISLWGYRHTAAFLEVNFSLTRNLANALGFLLTAVMAEALLSLVLLRFTRSITKKAKNHRINKAFGLLPAIGEGIIVVAFTLMLILALPIAPSVKKDISDSQIGGFITRKTFGAEQVISEVFGGVIEDSLTYLTIKPESSESIPLNIEVQELTVDSEAEAAMLEMVNSEREKVGAGRLELRQELIPVARAHARDMWERKYFAHVSPDGKDVGDRLDERGVRYFIAGENLAMAPTTKVAHTGLMNSEGHRRNILEPQFSRVGIGVIDNGVYGKMFVQIFTE